MAEYELVNRNTTIAAAADVVKADIGISVGVVAEFVKSSLLKPE